MSLSKLTNFTLLSNTSKLLFQSQQHQTYKSTFQMLKTGIGLTTHQNLKNSSRIRFAIPKNLINQTQQQNNSSFKLIDKRFKNLNTKENFSSQVNKLPINKETDIAKKSIFKRFKEAYNKHGKVLIAVHIVTSCSWVTSFFILSSFGYDITIFLNFFEQIHIITHEFNESIMKFIENFRLEKFLYSIHLDYILSDKLIKSANDYITGNTLKHILTAVMLYKICTPLRYIVTLGGTRAAINLFKSKGIIPKKPPPGYSIQDMYTEKKFIYQTLFQKRLANQKERYMKGKQNLRNRIEKSQRMMKKKF